MTDARMNRRMAAMLSIRLDEADLDEVPDARDPRGVRWCLATLLRAAVIGVAAGAESLADARLQRHLGQARLATEEKVDQLSVGCELSSLAGEAARLRSFSRG